MSINEQTRFERARNESRTKPGPVRAKRGTTWPEPAISSAQPITRRRQATLRRRRS